MCPSLLRPLLFVAVAMMVATAGGWSIKAEDNGPTQLASPEIAAPCQAVRSGRLPDGRNAAPGLSMHMPGVGLPGAVAAPAFLVQVEGTRSQARPLTGQVLSAERTNRGPPKA